MKKNYSPRIWLARKRADSKRRGIPCHLTLPHLYLLLYAARITIHDIGKKRGEYVLGRFDDTGPYELGNCRFITVEQNNAEWVASDEYRARASEHSKRLHREGLIRSNRKRDANGRYTFEETE